MRICLTDLHTLSSRYFHYVNSREDTIDAYDSLKNFRRSLAPSAFSLPFLMEKLDTIKAKYYGLGGFSC